MKNALPIEKLCIDYGVPVSWAFGLWRQYLGDEIRSFDKSSKIEDVEMTDVASDAIIADTDVSIFIDVLLIVFTNKNFFIRNGIHCLKD